jgi:hypothetical protein
MLKLDDLKPSVVYNTQKYKVTFMRIQLPSSHMYNNAYTAGELLIYNSSTTGGPMLIVCIPIVESTNTSTSTYLLTQIINSVAANAPRQGEKTNINLNDFTLNSIVPKKPFYTYKSDGSSFIVYGLPNAIQLNINILTTLSKIISQNTIQQYKKSGLFYNSRGPGKINNNGIYISCKPTGFSEKETSVATLQNGSVYTGNNMDTSISTDALWNDPTWKMVIEIIFYVIIFLIFFAMLNYAYIYATENPPKLFGFGNSNKK